MNVSERHFPNHKMERDIGLAEYSLAASRLSAEESALNWAKTASLAISTIIVFISFKAADYSDGIKAIGLSESQVKLGALIFLLTIGFMAAIHVSNLMKSKHLAERKIIVLRRMLGVSYGENTLVLPNWRLEGADSPFSIHLFPGYLSPKSFPIHLIIMSMTLGVFLLGDSVQHYIPSPLKVYFSKDFRLQKTFAFLVCFGTLLAYRYHLREMHDNIFLSISKLIAKMFRIRIVPNFESAIYFIKLDVEEAKRIQSHFECVERMAILIEDTVFFHHRGISWRGMARAIKGKFIGRNLGGGSTISQQFARGNFIKDLTPACRRKPVEIALAVWVESTFSKKEILLAYLTTARFDFEVYGFHRASKHFFEKEAAHIGSAEAFFLIERLGNIHGHFLGRRILQLLRRLREAGELNNDEISDILDIYRKAISKGLIKEKQRDLTLKEVEAQITL
ncbi:biosynthetic peptidoglycan transglycosylase [Epibacterium sp. Ofav1-8]|uniref:biosynthetic peptidoglycan transglycosylase n=1 Tax=Epibacterium sp. Ofav1-8 TaxID=2917735 RepID=UPI001EF5C1F7|nr:biosynthetic peptidoglycan transglycosylase [Epibacterium sp. Ofav1-8]